VRGSSGKVQIMKLYADRPLRLTNQVLGDLLILGWILLWIWIGVQLHDVIARLAGPGVQAEEAGRALQGSLGDAADNVGDVPLAGDALRSPFDEGAGAGRDLAKAAQSYQDTVADLAVLAGVLVAVAPIVVVIGMWLPRRLEWIVAASSAKQLLRGGGERSEDLFALRGLSHRPLHELARVDGPDDLMAGWRNRDPEVLRELARLELDDLGLRA
jgi:hypothetical protein